MSEIYLNKLANSNADWLSARQTLIAGNIANSSTPGYRAKDVKAFTDALQSKEAMEVARTQPKHLASYSSSVSGVNGVGTELDETWETYHSGGNVSLPQEMIKAGEVSTSYQLNTGVMKAFHRMVVAAFGN